jgi:hypothetical protein
MGYEALATSILSLDTSRLGLEQLRALLKAAPQAQELADLTDYLMVRARVGPGVGWG